MRKEQYESVELEIYRFSSEDVIMTSPLNGDGDEEEFPIGDKTSQ